jgi:hypothetical protein
MDPRESGRGFRGTAGINPCNRRFSMRMRCSDRRMIELDSVIDLPLFRCRSPRSFERGVLAGQARLEDPPGCLIVSRLASVAVFARGKRCWQWRSDCAQNYAPRRGVLYLLQSSAESAPSGVVGGPEQQPVGLEDFGSHVEPDWRRGAERNADVYSFEF